MNQAESESKFSKRNIRKIIKHLVTFNASLESWSRLAALKIDSYLNQETNQPKKIQRLNELKTLRLDSLIVSIAASVLRSKEIQTLQQVVGWLQVEMPHESVWDRAKTAAELLAVCEGDIYLIHKYPDRMAEVEPTMFLDNSLYEWINSTEFNLPLLEPPKPVTDNYNCGYHSIREPVILGGWLKFHEEEVCLDVINILNQQKLSLDLDVYAQDLEMPSKMTPEQKHAFRTSHGKVTRILLKSNNKFWFAWQYDTRGRIYSHGWSVNFQSFEYVKALISPVYTEKVTK
jgi:hypothetical protein